MLSFQLKDKLQNIKLEYANVGVISERCDHFLNLLENYTDTVVLESVINEFSNFTYLPLIKNSLDECVALAQKNQNKYLVEKTIYVIEQLNDPVVYSAVKKLQPMLEQSEAEIQRNISLLEDYDFIPQILNLRKAIHYYGDTARSTDNVKVSTNQYSPVIKVLENKFLFNLDTRFYILDSETKKIEENFEQVDPNFIERTNFFKQCIVNEDSIIFYHNGKKFKIQEDKFFIDEKEMNVEPVKLYESLEWTVGVGNNHIANRLYDLYENRNSITHLDFITRFQSKYNETPIAYNLMTMNESLYYTKVNTYNGESYFQEVASIDECVDLFKSELNYDITENVKSLKDSKEAMINENKDMKSKLVEKLVYLNEELNKYKIEEQTAENKAVVSFLTKELKDAQLQYNVVAENLGINESTESMEDQGYVEVTSLSNFQGVKKGQTLYALSSDLTSKKDKETIRCKTSNGTECNVPKGMIEYNTVQK